MTTALERLLGPDALQRELAALRAAAEARGSGDFSPLWAGCNASGCRDVGAAELTRHLASGWDPSARSC